MYVNHILEDVPLGTWKKGRVVIFVGGTGSPFFLNRYSGAKGS